MPALVWPRACRCCGSQADLCPDRRKPGGVNTLCRRCRRDEWRLTIKKPSLIEKRSKARRRWAQQNRQAHSRMNARNARKALECPDPNRWAIGQAVKAWRLANGLSQPAVAKLIGVATTTYRMRERGAYPWTLDVLDKFRRAGAAIPDEVPKSVLPKPKRLRMGKGQEG